MLVRTGTGLAGETLRVQSGPRSWLHSSIVLLSTTLLVSRDGRKTSHSVVNCLFSYHFLKQMPPETVRRVKWLGCLTYHSILSTARQNRQNCEETMTSCHYFSVLPSYFTLRHFMPRSAHLQPDEPPTSARQSQFYNFWSFRHRVHCTCKD